MAALPESAWGATEPLSVLDDEALQAYNQLVCTLYSCLHENTGFQPFFDAFQKRFKALQGGILGVSASSPRRVVCGWTFGYPEGFEEWYIKSNLSERDGALNRFAQLPPRQFDSIMRGDTSCSILDRLDPECHAWVEAAGIGDSAGMLITRENGTNVIFMANRHKDYGPYTDDEIRQMNVLAPHIENAVALYLKLYQSPGDNGGLLMAFNHVSKPLLVFNSLVCVAQANDAAMALLSASDDLFIGEDQRLYSSDKRITRKLHDAVLTCFVNSTQGILDTQTLFVENGNERIAVHLTPLMDNGAECNGVLAELFSFSSGLEPDPKRIQLLFECTSAEAAIAALLIRGLSANEIAEERQISVHTARQHIKSLLAKNCYRKQTELVSMMVRALG